jgi:UDP-4-amino-4,6-dideoxy-N-acetyl-beta-L-altrosamine transaminase
MEALTTIPYGRQSISEDDIQAVVDVLRSDWLTQGPAVPAFEQAVAQKCDAQYAVATNSATSALHIACLALGVGAGDRVWTTPNTFVASANCVRYCGADVDFVDIDPVTMNLSIADLANRLTAAEKNGTLPKVVIPVHFAGLPCDMQAIHALSKKYGFRTIEDASHAIGARYLDEPIGSGRYSDITIFSFHPVKIITTAEGGMAVTNNEELAATMALLRSHGITRDVAAFHNDYLGPWQYEQHELGFNYRLTDLQAALGTSQLHRLEEFVARRNSFASKYDALLADLPLCTPYRPGEHLSGCHLYVIRLDDAGIHREVFETLRTEGILVNLHYTPVHLQPYYRQLGFAPGDFPNAEQHGTCAISLPLYPAMSDDDIEHVVTVLTYAIEKHQIRKESEHAVLS